MLCTTALRSGIISLRVYTLAGQNRHLSGFLFRPIGGVGRHTRFKPACHRRESSSLLSGISLFLPQAGNHLGCSFLTFRKDEMTAAKVRHFVGLAEWLKALSWKGSSRVSGSQVRILNPTLAGIAQWQCSRLVSGRFFSSSLNTGSYAQIPEPGCESNRSAVSAENRIIRDGRWKFCA